jgi:hypothetical protein
VLRAVAQPITPMIASATTPTRPSQSVWIAASRSGVPAAMWSRKRHAMIAAK